MFNRYFTFLVSVIVVFVLGCSLPAYYKTNKSYKKQAKQFAKIIAQQPSIFAIDGSTAPVWVGTTNFNMRKPNYVVIHHTAQNSCDETYKTFTLPRTQVSAHYVICKDGKVQHMLNDYLRAWHAGAGKWGNTTDVNSSSIGIEIDNNGFEAFTTPQINSLLQLLDTLKRKYAIPAANFVGHADIAPTRKNDPNIQFPWKILAGNGYGLWYGDTTNLIVPANFSNKNALRIIGYDVKDSVAALRAFKRHFLQDSVGIISEPDKKILFDLMNRSL